MRNGVGEGCKLGIHLKTSYVICPKPVFFTHFNRKITHVIHVGSKVRYRSSSITPIPPPTRRISDFLALSRDLNVVRSFDVPLASHWGLKLESAHEVLDFEFV
ncbi:hypothetical protein AVEN_174688-1 [Araneus ventricosus]|uniref:Uncharacterized protein n=1 Tax=Araneus ventricosus TaxID=182803 RepID=A0A4Y2BMH5_ARAVE|nr:hypothetical protein AVEN_174688-1 [Araneus ventricosus]